MRKIVLGIMVAGFSALSASAALVVDFAWEEADGGVVASSPGMTSAFGATWNFSDTQKLIASKKRMSATVYGGMVTTWTPAQIGTYIPPLRWSAKTPGFQVLVNPENPRIESSAVKGILLWEKADFLNGANSGDKVAGFAPGNMLTAEVAFTAPKMEFRFVVNQGGTYYVSDTKGQAEGVFAIDPTTTLWRTISTDNNYTIGTTAVMLTLNDIQAVGIYMSGSRSTGQLPQTIILIKKFQADATVVPAMILGFGATGHGMDAPSRQA